MAAALLLLRALRHSPEPGPRRPWGLLSGRGPGLSSGAGSRRPYVVRGTPVGPAAAGGHAPQVTRSEPGGRGGCGGSARTGCAPAPSSSARGRRRADVGSAGREAASASGGSCIPGVCARDALYRSPWRLKTESGSPVSFLPFFPLFLRLDFMCNQSSPWTPDPFPRIFGIAGVAWGCRCGPPYLDEFTSFTPAEPYSWLQCFQEKSLLL